MEKRPPNVVPGGPKAPAPRPTNDYGRFGQALALGTNMAAGMALFTAIGYWIDHKRGGGFGWTLAGMFLGLIYGVYELWKAAQAINQGMANKPKNNGA